ncbi:MAG: O-antigen ligase family protein [Verrucomicrobiota bacterium]
MSISTFARESLPRFVLVAGSFLVLSGIYAFGGRTDGTLRLLTALIWLAIGIVVSLRAYYLYQLLREKGQNGVSRSRSGEKRVRSEISKPLSSNLPSVHFRLRKSLQTFLGWRPSNLTTLTTLCWGVLIVIQYIGFENPSFYPAGPELTDGMYALESNPFLPTTASTTRGTRFLWIFSGTLIWTALTAAFARNRKFNTRAVFVVFFGFGILAAFGALARLSGTEKILWLFESHTPYFFGTLFYKNHWGELAALMSAVGIGLSRNFWKEEKHEGHFPDRTVSFSCLVFLVALTIPLASARGATLALGGIIMAFTVTLLRKGRIRSSKFEDRREKGEGRREKGEKSEPRRMKSSDKTYPSTLSEHGRATRPTLRRLADSPTHRLTASLALPLLSLVALLSALGAFFYLSEPSLEKGLEKTETQWGFFKDSGDAKYPELRGYLWEDALRAFSTRPLTGWGIGSYVYIQFVYAGEKLRSLGDGQTPPLVEFAHNDYIQWLVEFGLIGTILLILPPIAAVVKIARFGEVGTLASWIAVGLVAFLFTAAIDFPFGNPALALTSCWLAAVAYGDSMANRAESSRRFRNSNSKDSSGRAHRK